MIAADDTAATSSGTARPSAYRWPDRDKLFASG